MFLNFAAAEAVQSRHLMSEELASLNLAEYPATHRKRLRSDFYTNFTDSQAEIKFVFSKKATKIDKIFTIDLTICGKCQIDQEDFVKFCGLLRKHEL